MKPARITLTVPQGNLEEKEHVFEERADCTIGRAEDCDIQLPRDYGFLDVSRHHCVLEIDPPNVQVRDLGSRNGTYVNGEKIGQRPGDELPEEADLCECQAHELKDGDEIRVGHAVLRVGIGVASETAEAAYFPMHFV